MTTTSRMEEDQLVFPRKITFQVNYLIEYTVIIITAID